MTAARRSLRRYPALGFLAVAALLASLLPSALRVPLSGPSASAELAPVPGKSDATQGDLSALNETSTGGLGSGGGTGGVGGGRGRGGLDAMPGDETTPPPPDDGSGRNPSNKRCVGNPPRQTEDSMSPACVRFFKGDNFGATSKGVTRDEIRVVALNGCDTNGSFRVEELQPNGAITREWTAFVRYFNERFQTYERRVRVFWINSTSGGSGNCAGSGPAAWKTLVQGLDAQLQPFFILHNLTLTEPPPAFHDEAARLGIMTATHGAMRDVYRRNAPFVVGYQPDIEHQAASVVQAVCARLAGRAARFHGDPAHRGDRRRFGLVYGNAADPDGAGAGLIVRGLQDRCPAEAGEVVVGYVRSRDRPQDLFVRFRIGGVTTVLAGVYSTDDTAAADASGFQGEWFLFDNRDDDETVATGGSQATRAFGLIDDRRLGPAVEQPKRLAVTEGGCGECVAEERVYSDLLLLFSGIQAAGPRLTPAAFDKGLRALPARQSRDPLNPSAYFGPGDHFFAKDYMFGWWDPAGRRPMSHASENPVVAGLQGCWRLVEDGLRYRPEDWANGPQGDDGIQQRTPEQPCQGPR